MMLCSDNHEIMRFLSSPFYKDNHHDVLSDEGLYDGRLIRDTDPDIGAFLRGEVDKW